jgi:hypothetical protein
MSSNTFPTLLDHLPPLRVGYEPELTAPEPADNETLPDEQ